MRHFVAVAEASCHRFHAPTLGGDPMNETGETWYVKLANGDVHPVTIDQLDLAFQEGRVDANTLVLSADADGWMRLGEVAGLDEGAPAATAAPPPPTHTFAAPVISQPVQ